MTFYISCIISDGLYTIYSNWSILFTDENDTIILRNTSFLNETTYIRPGEDIKISVNITGKLGLEVWIEVHINGTITERTLFAPAGSGNLYWYNISRKMSFNHTGSYLVSMRFIHPDITMSWEKHIEVFERKITGVPKIAVVCNLIPEFLIIDADFRILSSFIGLFIISLMRGLPESIPMNI